MSDKQSKNETEQEQHTETFTLENIIDKNNKFVEKLHDCRENNPSSYDLTPAKEFFKDFGSVCDVSGLSYKDVVEEGIDLFYNMAMNNKVQESETVLCSNGHDPTEYLKNKLELIDRTDFSEKEKPREWNCRNCSIKLGGGCKWYTDNERMDICESCYDDFKNQFKLLDFNTYWVSERSERDPIVLVSFDKLESLKIPATYEKGILENYSNGDIYEELSDSIVHNDHRMNNLMTWLPFTDDNVCSLDWDKHRCNYFQGAEAWGLLMNCETGENNGQIASVVYDDHGRASVDIIYDSLDDYEKDYEEWGKNKLSDDDRIRLIKRHTDTDDDEYEEDEVVNTEWCKMFPDFAGYIRAKLGLPFYYG